MERWLGRVALVTGAACGIGAAVSRQLARHGMKVVGCDIDEPGLQVMETEISMDDETVKRRGSFYPAKCDLRREEEIMKMFESIKLTHGGLSVCVNVAGVGHRAHLLEGPTWMWREMLDLNVLAYAICAREALKQMHECHVEDGHVVLINSLAGHRVRPHRPEFNFYCATKHAVTAIGKGLVSELQDKRSKIRISQICPGIVQTEFTHRMFKGDEHLVDELYSSLKVLEAKDIADAVIYALRQPPSVQVDDIRIYATEQE